MLRSNPKDKPEPVFGISYNRNTGDQQMKHY